MWEIVLYLTMSNQVTYVQPYKYITFYSEEKCEEFISSPQWKLGVTREFHKNPRVLRVDYTCSEDGRVML